MSEQQFSISVVGEETGLPFGGPFKVRTRLSFRQQLFRDERRRQLLGEVPAGTIPSDRARQASEMFAELDVRIVDAPKWWRDADNGLDLQDDNVLIEVHAKTMKAVADADAATKDAGTGAQADLKANQPKE